MEEMQHADKLIAQPQASPAVAGTRAVLVLRQELARTRRQALARRLEPSAQTDATTPQEHGSDGRTPAESYAAPLQRGKGPLLCQGEEIFEPLSSMGNAYSALRSPNLALDGESSKD